MKREEAEQLVRLSYPYVALYNVLYKEAFVTPDESASGFNRIGGRTWLNDHHKTSIGRPNNDTLLCCPRLDLRNEPMVLSLPVFDSDYVSIEACGFDHYCRLIDSTRQAGLAGPTNYLFYTRRTARYAGEAIEGINRCVQLSCDFSNVPVRVMPHANEAARFERIVAQLHCPVLQPLSEWRGQSPPASAPMAFPPGGRNDPEVFGTNLFEVMALVFAHTDFDPAHPTDREVMAAWAQFGLEPGWANADRFRRCADPVLLQETAEQLAAAQRARLAQPVDLVSLKRRLFRPKEEMSADAWLFQSVTGPIGLPAEEALYEPVQTKDGTPLNARHDYRIRMHPGELPPAQAFWSMTLYDTRSGFFVPNERKKYSVGQNAGMQLDSDGGIEIRIAAEPPADVPAANWLPVPREDRRLDLLLRIYAPDLAVIDRWQPPQAERIDPPIL